MITKTLASIILFGDKFSPARAEDETGLHFTKKHEAGEIGTKHRFKGKPYPFGHAVINTATFDGPPQLDTLLDSVLPHIETLRNLGVTHGKLQLTYSYRSQCNLEFEPEFLAKLARTGFELAISCMR